MFTPQRPPWSSPPSSTRGPTRTASRTPSASDKGKALAYADGPTPPMEYEEEEGPPPPPLGSRIVTGYDGGDSEDWKRFKEAGLLDAAAMERKDREALMDRISRLKRELFDYQYNMGVLLLEKNDLSSKCEELMQRVAEAQEILKRQQAANVISFREAKSREENLRRALELEKKRVLDLDKALRETSEESEQLKASTEKALADADAHRAELEAKGRELEEKLLTASRRHAEADSKLSQLERQMQELETRESILKSEQLSLTVERKAHEDTFRKQKEDLLEWERKLQQVEEKHCKQRSTLNEREEELNEREETYRKKLDELEETQKNADSAKLVLQDMENDINSRLAELVSKEEGIDASLKNLEYREKQVLAFEERLHAKERVDIPNLLDERRTILDSELQELELNMQQKKSIIDEEFRTKFHVIEQKEIKINHLEAKLKKREETLEKKLEKFKVKEEELEAKMRTSMEKYEHIQSEERDSEAMKQQILAEKDTMQLLKIDIERLSGEVMEKEAQIHEEHKKLKIGQEKRAEHLYLQKEVMEEMGQWKHQNHIVLNEIEELKQDRQKFKKEWDALGEKRTSVVDELKQMEEEKLRLEKLQSSEEQRLQEEKLKMEEKIAQEMEVVRLEKESFGAKMKHGHLVLSEKAQNEHMQMVQHFEQLRRELEENMRKKQEELEDRIHKRQKAYEEERLEKIRNLNLLKEVAEKRKEERESCLLQIEREKQELALCRKLLEEDQLEIQEDIGTIGTLGTKLKKEREQLINERSSFLTFLERVKRCNTCGDSTRDFVLSDIILPNDDESQPFLALNNKMLNELPPALTSAGSPDAGKRMSLLQKCSSAVHKLLPEKRVEVPADARDGLNSFWGGKYSGLPMKRIPDQGETRAQFSADLRPGQTLKMADDSGVQEFQLNDTMTKAETQDSPSANNLSNAFTEILVPDDSQVSELQSVQRKRGGKRKVGVRGKRTAKETVDDTILGETSKSKELDVDKQPFDSVRTGKEAQESSSQSHVVAGLVSHGWSDAEVSQSIESEQYMDVSEGRADSEAVGHRKRRKTISLSSQPPGGTRYNLRHRKISGSVTATKNVSNPAKDHEVTGDDGRGAKQTVRNPENHPSLSTEVTTDRGKQDHSIGTPSEEDPKPSSDAMVELPTSSTAADGNRCTTAFVESASFYEVADTIKEVEEEEEGSSLGGDGDDGGMADDHDDDESSDDPAPVSIGKQIWNFFTT